MFQIDFNFHSLSTTRIVLWPSTNSIRPNGMYCERHRWLSAHRPCSNSARAQSLNHWLDSAPAIPRLCCPKPTARWRALCSTANAYFCCECMVTVDDLQFEWLFHQKTFSTTRFLSPLQTIDKLVTRFVSVCTFRKIGHNNNVDFSMGKVSDADEQEYAEANNVKLGPIRG